MKILKISQTVLCTDHPFTQPPNPMCITILSIGHTSSKVPLPVEASTPHVIPAWTHTTQHPILHLDRFSRFREEKGEEEEGFHTGTSFPHFKSWLQTE